MNINNNKNALIFGSSGTIGSAILNLLLDQNLNIYTAGLNENSYSKNHLMIDYENFRKEDFLNLPSFESIVWAHGLNCSDKITNFNEEELIKLFNSNVLFIAKSISALVELNKIERGARLLVISSIWQIESRKNKFSYSVTKSALQGLIKSASIDLGELDIIINAVLPGVIDSKMTRKHLTSEQIQEVKDQTILSHLPEANDIASAVSFLVSPLNKSITGQFLTIDSGFTGTKNNL